MFKDVVVSVVTDKSFDLATQKAQMALLAADKLLKFTEKNERTVEAFCITLLRKIRECSHPRAVTCHSFRERMWTKFYQLALHYLLG